MEAIHFTSPIRIQAARKGPARFDAVFYTGGALTINGYDLPVVVDLAGLTNGSVLVANLDHDPKQRVGNFAVDNDGRRLKATGLASAATPARDEVIASAREGYVWQASLEVQPRKVDTIKRGESVQVNGRDVSGPVYVTRKGILKGFAFVSHGADDDTTVSIAAKARKKRMLADFNEWAESVIKPEALALMTDDQLAAMHANFEGRTAATQHDHNRVLPYIQASADPVEVENRRLRQIDAAVRGDWGDHADRVSTLRAQAISGDLTVDQLLAEMRPIRSESEEARIPMAHTIRSTPKTAEAAVIEAALCQATNLPNLERHFDEQTLQAAHTAYKGRIGLQQLLLEAAAKNGYRVRPGEQVSSGNLREIMMAAFAPQHGAAFSTFSVPGILSNVGNKSSLQGWVEGDQSWRQIAQVKSSKDFKTATSYRLLETLDYEQLSPAGEIPHGTIGEESYTRQLKTYGKMFSITRTDLINDDLQMFDDLRMGLGRGGLTKFNEIVWARFVNNSTFFTSGHANVSTGSPGSVLGTDGVGLQAAVLAFRKLLSPDGKSVDGEPIMLVVPPELEFNARRLYQSTNIVATGDTDATTTSANVFGGLYRPIIQRRLSNSAYTEFSTTAWYLLRDPSIAAVVAVSFLDGQQSPTVETAQADFNTLGIQMRAYHDWGADLTVDYLAGIRSAGA